MAKLTNDPEIEAVLETALARQKTKVARSTDPMELVKEAIEGLVLQGFDALYLPHISMEISNMVSSMADKEWEGQIPDWKKDRWMANALRSMDLVEKDEEKIKEILKERHGSASDRKRVRRRSLRVTVLSRWYVESVLNGKNKPEMKPADAICKEGDKDKICAFCDYNEACMIR